MKELSLEQKAKRYDEALERARTWKDKSGMPKNKQGILDDIFPELAESEDERIRKEIMDFIDTKTINSDERRNRWFSYLEKYKPIPFTSLEDTKVKMSLMQYILELNQDVVRLHPGIETCNEWLAWLEKQGNKDTQVLLPTFTFDDILVLQCCMETTKKVQEDKDLYEKLNDLHGRVYDAYQLEKRSDNCLVNFDEAEKEKYDFVGDGFIKCFANFLDFKEGETYWLEYMGDDKYNVRSDNLLGKTYHITPCQLYTVFKKLTWLEKQGEHTDKIEPKFHEGDWVVSDKNNVVRIKSIDSNYYVLENTMRFTIDYVDKCWHLWSIQDAKDGDILRIKNLTFIFQEITNNNVCHKDAVVACCSYEDNDDAFGTSGPDCITDLELITPVTKEQRDLLFQKMNEAGYEWDDKKKELKKIIDKEQIKKNIQDNSFRRMFEQNPAEWSEEDEAVLEVIKKDVMKYWSGYIQEDVILDWLKSLKDRIQPQPKQE